MNALELSLAFAVVGCGANGTPKTTVRTGPGAKLGTRGMGAAQYKVGLFLALVGCRGAETAVAAGVDAGGADATVANAALRGDAGTIVGAADSAGQSSAPPFSVEGDYSRLVHRGKRGESVVLDLRRHLPAERFRGDDTFDVYQSLAIAKQGDFDGDGRQEAIVALLMGGNACGPSYALVTERDVSPTFEACAGRLDVADAGGLPEFVVTEQDKVRRFVFVGGKMVQKHSADIPRLAAVNELLYEDVQRRSGPAVLRVDLDGDGRPDTIECSALRFLSCDITNADGAPMGSVGGPARLGVLKTSTRGHQDLVVGRDDVIRWSGKQYQ